MTCSLLHATAAHLLALLSAPGGARVELAGSIRRRRPDPHDIELVAAPVGDEFDNRLLELQMLGILQLDPAHKASGPRYQRRLFRGAPVDIFMVRPPAQWGVIFAIRTGPAGFNTHTVTARSAGGLMPARMRCSGGQLWRDDMPLTTPEEADHFRELGIPFWSPEQRTLARLLQWQRDRQ